MTSEFESVFLHFYICSLDHWIMHQNSNSYRTMYIAHFYTTEISYHIFRIKRPAEGGITGTTLIRLSNFQGPFLSNVVMEQVK